ncbi:organic solvents resistance ABC transporter permease [Bifidobacterium margollesii]|uniref:Organic solvents resistance ABC transporter permease n=1 Tax=Bifidobacterium margollesii TaxID=2020964 RepID=A0A2N5J994_9BIFI|nr:DUF5719 family protein [Bifidobacterium margollesii]PLS30780.1 organic solvents resistance ABC transporter permease [Bifidobacterium margollesii]
MSGNMSMDKAVESSEVGGTSRRNRRNGGSRFRSVGKITVSAVTIIILVLAFAVLGTDVLPDATDRGAVTGTRSVKVGQTVLQSYCPARMRLADTGSYGDSEYQVSEGNNTGRSLFAAFGSVYDSDIARLDGSHAQKTKSVDLTDTTKAFVHGTDDTDQSLLQTTRMLDMSSGSGSAASTVSWATEGDLQGVSATRCVSPQLSQSFLLPDTRTGWTQQMVLANPSDKSTSVKITAWGAKNGEPIALATDSTVTVAGRSETVVNLSAAVPDQQAVYVSISSETTAVSAVVRVVHMDGLTPKGSDFATPLAEAADRVVLPGMQSGANATIDMYAGSSGDVTLFWITRAGLKQAKQVTIKADTVSRVALGKVPANTVGVMAESKNAIQAAAICDLSGSGDGQSDFSLINGVTVTRIGAIVLPQGVKTTLNLVNTGEKDAKVSLIGYKEDGSRAGRKDLSVPARSGIWLQPGDVASGIVAMTMTGDSRQVAWGGLVHVSDVDRAKVRGIAFLEPTSLMPVQATVRTEHSLTVVQ